MVKRVWGGAQEEDPSFAQTTGRSRSGRSSGRSKEEGLQEGVLRSLTRATAGGREAVRPLYEASHFSDVHIVEVPVGGGRNPHRRPHRTHHPRPKSRTCQLSGIRAARNLSQVGRVLLPRPPEPLVLWTASPA